MAKQKTYALGIDLGGTKTLAAVVDVTTGEVIELSRWASGRPGKLIAKMALS